MGSTQALNHGLIDYDPVGHSSEIVGRSICISQLQSDPAPQNLHPSNSLAKLVQLAGKGKDGLDEVDRDVIHHVKDIHKERQEGTEDGEDNTL